MENPLIPLIYDFSETIFEASDQGECGTVDRLRAEMLLLQCRGDEIWSVEHCREQCIPDVWVQEMQDCFESGFDTDRNTIYESGKLVNQYHGVSDLLIAYRLAEFLGIDVGRVRSSIPGRTAQVAAFQSELDEI